MKTNPSLLEMRRCITGFQLTQAIYASAKLGIADYIQKGITSCNELASLTKTKPEKLYRLLRTLASEGIFFEAAPYEFHLTDKAKLLCADHPNSLKHYALMYGEEAYQSWKELFSTLSSETCGFEMVYKQPFFEYLANNPEANSTFNLAMQNSTASFKGKAIHHYDFNQFKTLIDIGGGVGEFLVEILEQFPGLQTTLLEQPEVIEQAKKQLAHSPYFEKIKYLEGDFFKPIPAGYDAYVMRHIIHDWPDEKAITILSHCANAMAPHSVLLLIEGVIKSANISDITKWIDLHMMVSLNSKERSQEEFNALFNASGLRLKHLIPIVGSHLNILEVVKA
jgi:hypothetical protein